MVKCVSSIELPNIVSPSWNIIELETILVWNSFEYILPDTFSEPVI